MKKVLVILTFLFLSLGFYAFVTIEHTLSSILKQLDLTEEYARDHVWSNISYTSFSYPYPGELRKTPNTERAAIVTIIGNFAKAYTKSNEFAARYREDLENRKPYPPQKPESMAETKKKQKEELTKSIASMEANKKKLPADQQSTFDNVINMMKEQLKEIDNPDNQIYNNPDADSYIQTGYEEQMKDYKEKLAQWEQEYKASPNEMVKRWLMEFLDQTEGIDFNAALKEEYGRKKFVNPEYESKPHVWKLCFRVGKPATETARAFAKSWLNELK